MSALTANRERHVRNVSGKLDGEVTGVDSDEFYEGGLVSWSASAATILPSADTALTRCVGVAIARTTTGSSNTKTIKYTYNHEEWFEHSGLVTSQEGDSLYVSDDNIVTDYAGSTNKVRVGVFRELETFKGVAGAWVFLDGLAEINAGGGNLLLGGVNGGPIRQWNHAGEGALVSRGTSASFGTNGDIMYAGWAPEYDQLVTTLNFLNATTVGTDKVIYAIYNLDGTLARSTALAGVTVAGADVYQPIALTATLRIFGGVEYLVAAQMEGTTAQLQFTSADFRGGTGRSGFQTGTFGTMATISSVSAVFAAVKGPLFFTS